jgi:regulator of protease activity HflC (stomatin/prohibitin superfamily)
VSTQEPINGGEQVPVPVRRNVSMSFRGAGAGSTIDPTDAMDPANQSLQDALKFTYRLVQIAMVILAVMFILSGLRTVKEGEQGIRLLFGKRDPELVQPGPAFSAPYPLGELVKVSTGVVTIDIVDSFWPYLSESDRARPLAELNGSNSLKPERDGSLITADGAIAHTQWRVRYSCTDPGIFSENLLSDIEQNLVKAAVQRGVVQAAAETKVDDLLKQGNDDASSLASRAREVAQRTLDTVQSGITIERLSLIEKMPPLYLKDKFAAVQTAQQNSQKVQEREASQAQSTLSVMAGSASPAIIDLINQYEVAIEKKDSAGQDRLLKEIDTILEGRAEEPTRRATGEVTRMLSDATQYRSSISNKRRSDLSAFLAKQEQFASNPLVTVHREWAEAIRAFQNGELVEVMMMPVGTRTLTMVINRDPEIAKRLETRIREREATATNEKRVQQQKDATFKVEEGLKSAPAQQ